jgi:biotin carboxyl carrier protein
LAGPAAGVPIELAAFGQPAISKVLRVDVAGETITGDDDIDVRVRELATPDDRLLLEIDGAVHEGYVLVRPHDVLVSHRGQAYTFTRPDAFGPGSRALLGDGTVTAPMPGTLLAVNVAKDDAVEEGDTLAVMEAMKMELALKAPFAGTVTSVAATPGAQVDLGAQLFVVEALADQEDPA